MGAPSQDGVILLHGIYRSARSMRRLSRFLASQGFATLNIDYPSTKLTLEQIVDHIQPQIETFAQHLSGKLHFVGYSMGGLVIRYLLETYRPENLGRAVMLGTPNHGSEIADFLARTRLYRYGYGPAGQQLTTRYIHATSPITYELGILAGSRSIDPICHYLIGAPNDGKVSVESTRLEGMKEHRIIRATHVFFPLNRSAWHHTLAFLNTGRFADKD